MAKKLVENTDPHDQPLFNESYSERGMEPQGSAGVGFCILAIHKDMKNNFCKILIVSTLFMFLGAGCDKLSGYSSSTQVKNAQEVSFEKKQKCATYIDDVKKNYEGSSFHLDEIFYSPFKDSCIYTGVAILYGTDGTTIIKEIKDYLTQETILTLIQPPKQDSEMKQAYEINFINKVDELKGINISERPPITAIQ